MCMSTRVWFVVLMDINGMFHGPVNVCWLMYHVLVEQCRCDLCVFVCVQCVRVHV